MRKALISTVLTALAGLVMMLAPASWHAAGAQPSAAPTGGKPAASSSTVTPLAVKRPPGLRGEIQQQLDEAEQELISLASVVPPEKFGWRPAPGVRSFGEVCLHVAGGNYEIGSAWGAKPPASVDLKKIEQQGADKGNAVAAMRVSFEVLRESIAAMPDGEPERQIDFFGRPGTVRAALILAAVHAHEHLGQLIAYARMNGVVPPWTARQQEKQKPEPKNKG